MKNLIQFKNVAYKFAGKWDFTATNSEGKTVNYRTKLPGGRQTADKVARQFAGAVARAGEMDNLGRVQIAKIIKDATTVVE